MKNNIVVVVTYGFDYSHEETLGVYGSMYKAKKAIAEVQHLLDSYDYVHRNTYVVNHTPNLYNSSSPTPL